MYFYSFHNNGVRLCSVLTLSIIYVFFHYCLTINIDTLSLIWYTKRIHVLYGKGQKLLIAYVIIISLVKLLKIEIGFYSVARTYLHKFHSSDSPSYICRFVVLATLMVMFYPLNLHVYFSIILCLLLLYTTMT